ncbi:hypothetical protein ACKLNR_006349 [Fusarium oxysporum f. sp. zingiberi]
MTEKVRITGLTEKSLLSSYIAIIRLTSHAVNQGLCFIFQPDLATTSQANTTFNRTLSQIQRLGLQLWL